MRKLFLAFALIVATTLTASAQTTAPVQGWDRVRALPIRSQIYVYDQSMHKLCNLKSVDAETLVCSDGGDLVYQRSEIAAIKIPHRARSAWTAEGITYAALAIVGGAAHTRIDNSLGASFIFAVVILTTMIADPFIGHHWDFMRTTIYKAS